MVHWPGADLAAFSNDRIGGVTQNGSGGDVLLAGITTYGGASRNAYLGRDGLGRGAFHGDDLHARSPSCQFWNNTAISDAPIRKGER